jgi:hypothetical protein
MSLTPAEKLIARKLIECEEEGYSDTEAIIRVANTTGISTDRVAKVMPKLTEAKIHGV